MNGTFNGLHVQQVTWMRTINVHAGRTRSTFRLLVADAAPKLERLIQLGGPALLALPSQEIEGKVVYYRADARLGYEITIES